MWGADVAANSGSGMGGGASLDRPPWLLGLQQNQSAPPVAPVAEQRLAGTGRNGTISICSDVLKRSTTKTQELVWTAGDERGGAEDKRFPG